MKINSISKFRRPILLFVVAFAVFIAIIQSCKKPDSPVSAIVTNISYKANEKIEPFNRIPKLRTLNATIEIKSKDILTKKVNPLPTEVVAKLKERLNRLPKPKTSNKSGDRNISISTVPTGSSSFSVSYSSDNTWNCQANLDEMPGYNYGVEWYLMNERTGDYMLLTVTNTTTLNFLISSPDYGYYHVFGYESVYATLSQTNDLLLGDIDSGTYPGVAYHDGILEFADLDHYKDMITQLEDEMELHNANFFDDPARVTLSDDDVNALAENQGFDEYAPLRDFENYFGFYSMRQDAETAEIAWMNNSVLSSTTDPDKNYPEDSEITRTVLNTDAEIKIALQSHSSTFESSSGCCRTNDRKFGYATLNNDQNQVKYVGSFHGAHLLLGTRIVARTKNFKKKSNGKWKKWATSCRAQIGGSVVDENCGSATPFATGYKPAKRRRSFESRRMEWVQFSKITSSGMGSSHSVVSNNYWDLTLSFDCPSN